MKNETGFLLSRNRGGYDDLINNENLLDKTNNRDFRDKLIKFLEKKIVYSLLFCEYDGKIWTEKDKLD